MFFYIGVNMVTHNDITVYASYYSMNILVYNIIILDVSFHGGFTQFTIVSFVYLARIIFIKLFTTSQ